jgi:hypothetical protein
MGASVGWREGTRVLQKMSELSVEREKGEGTRQRTALEQRANDRSPLGAGGFLVLVLFGEPMIVAVLSPILQS